MSSMGSSVDWTWPRRISEHKDTAIETSQTEMQREKRIKKTEQNIQELQDNYKRFNMYMMELSKRKIEKAIEKYLKY